MTERKRSRTLVKSTPELWAECSDAGSLARHLGAVGEIRITKLEPESAVAWEGAAACGTVRLEPSGWGTKVTLTMSDDEPADGAVEPECEPAPVAVEPEPEAEPVTVVPEPLPPAVAPRRPGMLARLLRRRRPADSAPGDGPPGAVAPPAEAEPMPAPAIAPDPVPAPVAQPPDRPPAGGGDELAAALDSLGRAHHRPYSRA